MDVLRGNKEQEVQEIQKGFLDIAQRCRDIIHCTSGEDAETELAQLNVMRQHLAQRFRRLLIRSASTASAAA